ncbi:MAG: Rid family hydrolase [Paludibacter sp.]|nr:Rid family hydrolase [Paludibacter sp.]
MSKNISVEYKSIQIDNLNTEIKLSIFTPKKGASEIHGVITLSNPLLSAEQQIMQLNLALEHLSASSVTKDAVLVWRRYFMSDPVNQYHLLSTYISGAISIVGQPPLNQSKITLWCYFIQGASINEEIVKGATLVNHSAFTHIYHTGLNSRLGNEYDQTADIFQQLEDSLRQKMLHLTDHLIRTWIFVQGVDTHYLGMIKARKEMFDKVGLTDETHYVASTGIEGRSIYLDSLVFMDAYSVAGLEQNQISYLRAPHFMCPTSNYGVTFERGTVIEYGDRRHIFISGTASIDTSGDVVFPFQIIPQTQRTIETIEALLKEADATLKDIAQLIVYLRDMADYQLVNEYLENEFPELPKVIVLAPVCRPGWLIEFECIAISSVSNSIFHPF